MAINFAKVLSVHDDALLLRSQRAEVLANNLTNADTPGFKSRDIDFHAALKGEMASMQQGMAMTATSDKHLMGNSLSTGPANLMYRNPMMPSVDGNTVDANIEQAEFMENSLAYQTSFSFLNSRFKGLKSALKGE